MYEVKSVGAFVGTVGSSLGKAGNFFGATLFPEVLVLAFEKVSVLFQFAGIGIEDCVELAERVDGGV